MGTDADIPTAELAQLCQKESERYRRHPYWDLENAHGVSIYFPQDTGSWDYGDYMGHDLFRFAIDTTWDDFLQAYHDLPPLPTPDPGLPPVLEMPHTIYLPIVFR